MAKNYAELIRARLEQVGGTLATIAKGLIYYNTSNDRPYVDDGVSAREVMLNENLPEARRSTKVQLDDAVTGNEIIGTLPYQKGGTGIDTLTGEKGKALVVNKTEDGWEFGTSGQGVPSMFKILNAEEESVGDWTVSGTTAFTFDTTDVLNGDTTYKCVLNAINDSVTSPNITVPERSREKVCGLLFPFQCDVVGADIRVVDVTNGDAVLTTGNFAVNDTNTGTMELFWFMPANTATIKVEIEAITFTGSQTIFFDDMVFDDEPLNSKEIIKELTVGCEGNAGQSITSQVTDIPFIGVKDPDNLWSGTVYTVQDSDSIVVLDGHIAFTSNITPNPNLYVNGVRYKSLESPQAGGSVAAQNKIHYTSFKGEFSVGDILSIRTTSSNGTLSNDTITHYLNINEELNPAKSIITQSNPSSETFYAPVQMNFWITSAAVCEEFDTSFITPAISGSKLLDVQTISNRTRLTARKDIELTVSVTGRGNAGASIGVYASNGDPIQFDQSFDTNAYGSATATLKISAGDYLYTTHTSPVSDRRGGINIYAKTVTESNIIQNIVPLDDLGFETVTKQFNSTQSSGDITDLTFNDLEVGERYLVTGAIRMQAWSSTDQQVSFRDGAGNTGAIHYQVNTRHDDATYLGQWTTGVSFIFTALNSNLYVNKNSGPNLVVGSASEPRTFIQVTKLPKPTGFLLVAGDGQRNRSQTKILQSTIAGTNTTVTDLTFSNLEIGRRYKVSFQGYFQSTVDDGLFFVGIYNTGQVLPRVSCQQSSAGDQQNFVSIEFVATNTTLTFATNDFGASQSLIGTGSLSYTWATLEEINGTIETTAWA